MCYLIAKTIITSLLFSIATAVLAQDVYVKIAEETCACISKNEFSKSSKQEIEIQLGLCMLESANNNKLEVDVKDNGAMTKLGEAVGLKMAAICPKIFAYLIEDKKAKEQQLEIVGKLKSIVEGDFNYVIVKDNAGREQKLIWLRYFKGSDELLENMGKLAGTKVRILYADLECYSPKAKSYVKHKEIIELMFEE